MLVHFDFHRDRFIMSGTQLQYWPDGTIKSTDNVFNWRRVVTLPIKPVRAYRRNANTGVPRNKYLTSKRSV